MRCTILTIDTDLTSLPLSVDLIHEWSSKNNVGDGKYVCVSNVHMCMETFDVPSFRSIVNNANLIVPDGRPLLWAQRLLGHKDAQQVRGMDLMLALCERSASDAMPVGFYGASSELLEVLSSNLQARFTGLNVVCKIAPPFRETTPEEDAQYVAEINDSGARILFVGLGCPKQERWMAEHKDKLCCVMLGVGAAFDFIAGNKRHAPKWMQQAGLEWLFRFISEPRRLWRRYVVQNPRFMWHFFWQLVGEKVKPKQ